MAISLQGLQPQAGPSIQHAHGLRSQIKQDVQSLSTALQSGDLATAQKSYADLQKLLQGNGSISQASNPGTNQSTAAASKTSSPLDAIKSDFTALGQDLQKGDLSSAQKDYQQLATDSQQVLSAQRSTAQTSGHHHHHRNDGDANAPAAAASTTLATSPTPAATAPTNASSDPIQNDFAAIGKDFLSGNLSGVQQDVSQLVKDAQAAQAANTTPGSSSTGNSAYQFQISASFDSGSVTNASSSGTTSTAYQHFRLQESLQISNNAADSPATVAANQPAQPANAYQFSYHAYQKETVSVLG